MFAKNLMGLALAAFLGIGSLSVCQPAAAQEPSASALAAAKELIIIKGGNNMFDPIVPGVIESAKNTLLPNNPQVGSQLNEVATTLRKEFDGKRTELLDEVARIYARHFTEQELKDLAAFYRTPLGKKVIIEEPAALDQGLRRAQEWANTFSEQVFNRFRTEMKKKGYDL
jgi:hypothetical protein